MTRVISVGNVKPLEMLPGVHRRTMSYSDKVMLTHFNLEQGTDIPLHSHPHDQITFVVEGEIELTIGGEAFVLKAGDSVLSPGNVRHGVKVIQKSVVIDVFAPPREDYK